MTKNNNYLNVIISVLFVIYLLILVWIILFKLQFPLTAIDHRRSVNLIPFHYSTSVGERFHIKEVIENILIFIPFGFFLHMLMPSLKLRNEILLIFGTSLALEMAQYTFAIGGTDITDLMTNTLGGIIGIGSYKLILKIFKDKQKIDVIISITSGIMMALLLGLLSILLAFN